MKRIFSLLLIILIFVSCGGKSDPLAYQKDEIVAECKINDKYTVSIIKKEGVRALEIIEPSELSDVSFICEEGEWSAVSGDMKIPIEAELLTGIRALTSIFDLSESAITTAYDDGALGVVSFEMELATYTVTYNEMSLPKRIQITSDTLNYDIEVISIKKQEVN